MKRTRVSLLLALALILSLTSTSLAQYAGYGWGTVYQLVNTGDQVADISIQYYDPAGNLVSSATRTFLDVSPGQSRKVIQVRDDTMLGAGKYSAVVASDQPLAAIVNQELYAVGSTNPTPPFSSYSGVSQSLVGNNIFLPVAMHNYYTYYTEIIIMNTGSSDATGITVDYYPTTVNGQVQGATGVISNVPTLKANASYILSQKDMVALGGSTGRFLGSAIVKSPSQPIAVVVNQHSPANYKLMTYNGFKEGATTLYIPNHMRGYYGYYNSLTITNPNATAACVRLTYTPTGSLNTVVSGTIGPVSVDIKVGPQQSINRYDGPTASDAQSDLDDSPNFSRFFGSVKIDSLTSSSSLSGCPASALPIVAITNVEAISGAGKDSQSGSFNAAFSTEATKKLFSPVTYSDFYGFYTSTVIQNTTGTATTCTFKYTSDSVESAVKNQSKTYNENLGGYGIINIYEGTKGGKRGHINTDPFWSNGTTDRFNGTLEVECGQPIVGYANLEVDISGKDSMYTYNLVNVVP